MAETKKRVTKISFGNYFEEGIYNATVAHLSDLKLDKTPDLLDYAYPAAAPRRERFRRSGSASLVSAAFIRSQSRNPRRLERRARLPSIPTSEACTLPRGTRYRRRK